MTTTASKKRKMEMKKKEEDKETNKLQEERPVLHVNKVLSLLFSDEMIILMKLCIPKAFFHLPWTIVQQVAPRRFRYFK